MIRGVHHFFPVRRDEFFLPAGLLGELVVFPDLERREMVRFPEFFLVDERGAERVVRRAFILPPVRSIGEAHGVVPGDSFAALNEATNLVAKSLRSRIVVVIPVSNEFSARLSTAEIPFFSDARVASKAQNPYPMVIRHQISYVLAVCQDEEFPVWVRLIQEALNRFREPCPAVPRQAQARHETVAAPLPLER